jgi:hypothetical protein
MALKWTEVDRMVPEVDRSRAGPEVDRSVLLPVHFQHVVFRYDDVGLGRSTDTGVSFRDTVVRRWLSGARVTLRGFSHQYEPAQNFSVSGPLP